MAEVKGAAKRSRLSALHQMFTEALIAELEMANKDKLPLPAADKTVIRTFLKDNEITADADDERMEDLDNKFHDELAEARKKRARELLGDADASDDELVAAGIL